MTAWGRELQHSFTTVARLAKPVIAAVTGYALGGGYELALCADFRVLGASAKIGQPEIQLGVIPGAGGTQRLARLVGPAKAKDLIFTGRHVGAEEALEIGLADAVVPDDEVYSTAWPWPPKFAAGPPLALAAAKRAIDEGLDCPSRRGSRWRAGCSPSSSTPRTRRPGCARSSTTVPARRFSRAADLQNVHITFGYVVLP